MPPLNEGSILYMPMTLPGISVRTAHEAMRKQDSILAAFPEVESVFGKAGRANTATDPAPLAMFETTIVLKPEDEWREGLTWDGPHRGDGRGHPIPGHPQLLDHAHQGPHRHAGHGNPDSGGREDLRPRSGRVGAAGERSGERRGHGSRVPGPRSPNDLSGAGT